MKMQGRTFAAKSLKTFFSVIPVKTGIQENQKLLDSRSPPARGQASRECRFLRLFARLSTPGFQSKKWPGARLQAKE